MNAAAAARYRRGCCLEFASLHVGDKDDRTRVCELACNREAQTLCGAHNDNNLIGELGCHLDPFPKLQLRVQQTVASCQYMQHVLQNAPSLF